MAAALRRVCGGVTGRVSLRSCSQQRAASTGRTFLLNRWPLPLLLVSSGGYLGYHKYKWREQPEGAPPVLATPTQSLYGHFLFTGCKDDGEGQIAEHKASKCLQTDVAA